jgi:hypothetical protein
MASHGHQGPLKNRSITNRTKRQLRESRDLPWKQAGGRGSLLVLDPEADRGGGALPTRSCYSRSTCCGTCAPPEAV